MSNVKVPTQRAEGLHQRRWRGASPILDGRLSFAEGDGPGFESFRMRLFWTVRGNSRGHVEGVFFNVLRNFA
jgi:hypothetical protein